MNPRTGTDDKPLTRAEADELREFALAAYKEHHDDQVLPKFTCSTCVFLAWCEFAYDLYNTDGDCLASK